MLDTTLQESYLLLFSPSLSLLFSPPRPQAPHSSLPHSLHLSQVPGGCYLRVHACTHVSTGFLCV